MLKGCNSLLSISDLSKKTKTLFPNKLRINDKIKIFNQEFLSERYNSFIWNKYYFVNTSCLFYGCNSLLSLPDISDWNMSNVEDMSGLFYG